jgi:uncharacterized membrane protein YccF (DUF307 family)
MMVYSMVLQICFCLIFTLELDGSHVDTAQYYFILWPFGLILIDELVKIDDRNRVSIIERKARLFFDTVLGMHSPK